MVLWWSWSVADGSEAFRAHALPQSGLQCLCRSEGLRAAKKKILPTIHCPYLSVASRYLRITHPRQAERLKKRLCWMIACEPKYMGDQWKMNRRVMVSLTTYYFRRSYPITIFIFFIPCRKSRADVSPLRSLYLNESGPLTLSVVWRWISAHA